MGGHLWEMNSLLKTQCEGVPLKQFEASSAIELWANAKVRRPDQHPGKKYKKRQSKKAKPILSMSDSKEEETLDSPSDSEAYIQ